MHALLEAPHFQVTLAAVVGIGVVALGLAMAVFKYFMPRLGKALLSPAPVVRTEEIKEIPPVLINPEFCTACKAEHERSVDNKAKIDILFTRTGEMTKSLSDLCVDMAVLKTGNDAILKAVTKLENGK